jgi:hypothetical protein
MEDCSDMEDFLALPHATAGSWAWGGEAPSVVLARLRGGVAHPATLAVLETKQQEAMEFVRDLEHVDRTRRFEHVWSEDGDDLDVGRALQGEDRPWRRMRRGRTAPVLRVGIGCTLSARSDPAQFAEWTATAVAVVDSLSVRGFGVEVFAVMAVAEDRIYNSRYYLIRVPLKAANEPVDVQRMCSVGTTALCRAWVVHRNSLPDGVRFSGAGYPCCNDVVREAAECDVVIGQCVLTSKTGWEQVTPFLQSLNK